MNVFANNNLSHRRPSHQRFRPASLLVAVLLFGGACSSSASDSDGAGSDAGGSDAESRLATTTTAPAADTLAGDTDDGDTDEGEDDDAMEESVAERGGGFFGDAANDEVDSDRLEDNTFEDYGIRSFVDTAVDPVSTFALDVDTASYAIARQWLDEGVMPPEESVRVEEFVNSFRYDYRAPNDGLAIVADGGPSPFDSDNVILRLGVQAEQVADGDRPAASLTFVIDTSGSMDRQGRLELVKQSLSRLVDGLDRDDSVAIVTYSDDAAVLLPPTSVQNRGEILEVIAGLQTTGSTNLEAGLQTGYDLAAEAFQDDGINRVILASDGVANVGLTDPDGLVKLIRSDADRGIQLVTVGVGMGNFNDVAMETLADDGDGFYAYVDTATQADKLFSEDLVGTLLTVAVDGKIQVDFNDEVVESYRLLGFENRAVLDSDFRNDDVDAGELGAGHQVTAIYELTLARGVRDRDSLGTAALRWEDPDESSVRESRLELTASMISDDWNETDDDFRLAVSVAAFAEILRGSPFAEDLDLDQVAAEARALEGNSFGDNNVRELVDLIERAAEFR